MNDQSSEIQSRFALLEEQIQAARNEIWALTRAMQERDFIIPPITTTSKQEKKMPLRTSEIKAWEVIDKRDQFYDIEYDDRGRAFRWTGPGSVARLRFWIEKSASIHAVIVLNDLGDARNSEGIRVRLDGKEIPYLWSKYDGDLLLTTSSTRLRSIDGYILLELDVPYMYVPHEHGHSDDRVLGVGIRSVRLVSSDE